MKALAFKQEEPVMWTMFPCLDVIMHWNPILKPRKLFMCRIWNTSLFGKNMAYLTHIVTMKGNISFSKCRLQLYTVLDLWYRFSSAVDYIWSSALSYLVFWIKIMIIDITYQQHGIKFLMNCQFSYFCNSNILIQSVLLHKSYQY